MHEIDVILDGAVAMIPQRDARIVSEILTYQYVRHQNREGEIACVSKYETLGRVRHGFFRFPTKLLFHLQTELPTQGISLRVVKPPLRKVTCDPYALRSVPEAFQRIRSHTTLEAGGLFHQGEQWRPDILIPHLIRLFSHYRILLAVRNRSEAVAWRASLRRRALPQPVYTTRDFSRVVWGNGPKVHITSIRWLDHCARRDFDLAILPHVGPLLDNDRWRDIADIDPVPVSYSLLRDPSVPAFGFVSGNSHLSKGERLRLLSFFTRFVEFPKLGPSRKTIHVACVPFRGSIGLAQGRGAIEPYLVAAEWKRWAIWSHGQRNRFVVSLAVESGARGRRTAILVENLEHANALGGLLPSEWAVVSAEHPDCPAAARHFVVTETGARRMPRLDADVVIDARGRAAIDPAAYPAIATRNDGYVEVIDIADVSDPDLAAAARRRRETYIHRGWSISDTPTE
jgi:hypothetical protein